MNKINLDTYNYSLGQIMNHFNDSIDQLLSQTYTKTPIFIFDIDDTLLSTIPLLNTCIKILPPNKIIVDLYHKLRNNGIKTGIITARSYLSRNTTIKNLIEVGITEYDEFFMREAFDLFQHIGTFKFNKRKYISNQYEIIGNIGDQETDFSYGLNGLAIKLPSIIY